MKPPRPPIVSIRYFGPGTSVLMLHLIPAAAGTSTNWIGVAAFPVVTAIFSEPSEAINNPRQNRVNKEEGSLCLFAPLRESLLVVDADWRVIGKAVSRKGAKTQRKNNIRLLSRSRGQHCDSFLPFRRRGRTKLGYLSRRDHQFPQVCDNAELKCRSRF